ncbi:flavin reductase family protein [Amycolatopsis sp. DSM 110486]|uniref:flavin reductase family protein n=1 Tax=Amycolatopsis sp. DSM 110486 TaxID=2865832 RepID=UPI001C6956E2|nr:flavin reductase family protein [Amycolatopsis sp. DSM 110486]QYN23226.1 flavin reductase family protein [Amycolatopsis sp. DSM 110486]
MSEDLPRQFREVMARVATPVSVVTGLAPDYTPYGSTVSAFASLSMEPPMVLVSLVKSSRLLRVIRQSGRFGLNILGSSHSQLARTFATNLTPEEKFDGVEWDVEGEVPRLAGALSWLACSVEQDVEGGDHIVLFGSVLSLCSCAGEPLTYHRRSFGTHATLER